MTEPFFSIGVDVAKKKLDVYSRSSGEHKVFPNDIKGLDSMFLYLRKSKVDLLICEPSGGYERLFIVQATHHRLPVAMMNARQIRDFAKAKNILAKTDKIDARLIAEYGAVFRPAPQQYKANTLLSDYLLRRRQLVDIQRREQQEAPARPGS